MANRLIKIATLTYTPGRPGVPAQPGRWEPYEYYPEVRVPKGAKSLVDSVYQAAIRIYGRAYGNYSLDIQGNSRTQKAASNSLGMIVDALMGTGPTAGGGLSEGAIPQIGYVFIKGTPGVPDIPAKVVTNPQSGWNGGGRSIRRIRKDGEVKFNIGPRSIGVLIGLSGPNDSQVFSEATHAFYLNNGVLSIVESGVTVAAVPGIDLEARPKFSITRMGGVVRYSVGSYSYTSAKRSRGDVYLDALLYTADDYVENPVLNELQSGRAEETLELEGWIDRRGRAAGELALNGLAVGRVNGIRRAAAAGSLRMPGTVIGKALNAGRATEQVLLECEVLAPASRSIMRAPLPGMISSEIAYARSLAQHGGYQMLSTGGAPELSVASSVAQRGGGEMRSRGITGAAGNSQARHRAGGAYSLDSQLIIAGAWGKSTAAKGGRYLTITGTDPYSPQEFVINEALLLADRHDVGNWQNVDTDEWLQLGVDADCFVMVEAEASELLILSDSVSVLYDIELAISEALYLSDSGTTRADGGLQVAVNMATSASSFYQGFDYLAIRSLDSASYGVKPDGIYRLGVGFGEPMNAEIDFGATELSRSAGRLQTIFIGASTDGDAYIKLTPDDGVEHTYRVIQRQPIMRADPGRGLSGRKWRLKLQLLEVTAAEVDMVEFVAAGSNRRGTR